MNKALLVLGGLLLVLGVTWFLQGVGILGEDDQGMTGESSWAVIGPLVAVAGIALLGRSRRARR